MPKFNDVVKIKRGHVCGRCGQVIPGGRIVKCSWINSSQRIYFHYFGCPKKKGDEVLGDRGLVSCVIKKAQKCLQCGDHILQGSYASYAVYQGYRAYVHYLECPKKTGEK